MGHEEEEEKKTRETKKKRKKNVDVERIKKWKGRRRGSGGETEFKTIIWMPSLGEAEKNANGGKKRQEMARERRKG